MRNVSAFSPPARGLIVAGAFALVVLLLESAAAILASQLLHAVTYGAFHMAGILYMDQLAPDSDKTLGQALNNAVTYGLGLTVGFFLSGALYEPGRSGPLFLFSAGVSLAGGVLFAGYHLWRTRTDTPPATP